MRTLRNRGRLPRLPRIRSIGITHGNKNNRLARSTPEAMDGSIDARKRARDSDGLEIGKTIANRCGSIQQFCYRLPRTAQRSAAAMCTEGTTTSPRCCYRICTSIRGTLLALFRLMDPDICWRLESRARWRAMM